MHHQHPMLSRYVIPDMPSADELLPHLRHIDDNQWYSNFGPLVLDFETRASAFLAQENPGLVLTTMMTCYHALHIGLQLFRLPPQARVLVPAVTFPACPLAVNHTGAQPVLADVDRTTWQLTPETARAIAQEMPIHAVMPVAVYGVPVDVAAWDAFTLETGIPVLIDAAAAFETQDVPHYGLVAYSLHATKPFCVGEGGLLVGRNRDWIEEARCRSNFGTQQRITLHDGSNAKMSEYHAAVGLAQMDRWEGIKQRRRKVLHFYRTAMARIGLTIKLQPNLDHAVVGALMMQTSSSSAIHVTSALNARGIMAHRMYMPPLYHHPHFANLDVVDEKGRLIKGTASHEDKCAAMTNSEYLHQSLFGMPFHTFLDELDIDFAVNVLAETLA